MNWVYVVILFVHSSGAIAADSTGLAQSVDDCHAKAALYMQKNKADIPEDTTPHVFCINMKPLPTGNGVRQEPAVQL